jgi:hypothetical protein
MRGNDMAINNIMVSSCGINVLTEKPTFDISIICDSPDDLVDKGVGIYFGKDRLFLVGQQALDQLPDRLSLTMTDDVAYNKLLDIISEEGMKSYTVSAIITYPAKSADIYFDSQIQFGDVKPLVDNINLFQPADASFVTVSFDVAYYSSDIEFILKNEKYNLENKFSNIAYDNESKKWHASTTVSTGFASCGERLEFTISGKSLACGLPCFTWSEDITLDKEIIGGCVSQTNWIDDGLHIYFDSAYPDTFGGLVKSNLGKNLVCLYNSPIFDDYSVFGKMIGGEGGIYNSKLLPSANRARQYGVDATSLALKDDFIAVWASNEINKSRYAIYMRGYSADVGISDGFAPSTAEVKISDDSKNSVCPRVLYNANLNLVFACWVSQAEKSIVGAFVNPDTLAIVSPPFNVSKNIHNNFSNAGLDINVSLMENIVLMNYEDGIIICYQQNDLTVDIISVKSNNAVSLVSSYTMPSASKFSAHLLEEDRKIMMVHTHFGNVYGAIIDMQTGSSTRTLLNDNSTKKYQRPYIHKLSKSGVEQFVVSWSSVDQIIYKIFNKSFVTLKQEVAFGVGGSSTCHKVTSSENQIAIFFQGVGKNSGLETHGEGIFVYLKRY